MLETPLQSQNPRTLFSIDSSIYIFQSYFGLPDDFFSRSGRPVNAVYGYTLWLLKFLLDVKPSYVSACFDESLMTGFRHEIDPNYKSNRALPDEELSYQLLACKKITSLLGIPCHASERYEADDLIASSARLAKYFDLKTCIVSRDKDLAQLLIPDYKAIPGEGKEKYMTEYHDVTACEEKAHWLDSHNIHNSLWHYPKEAMLNALGFYKKYQINPAFMADFLAIVGDSSDAIAGVPGIGAKTVNQLFLYFPGWLALRDNIDSISHLPIRGALRIQGLIQSNIERINKNIQLTTLVDNVFTQENLSDHCSKKLLVRRAPDVDGICLLFDEFNFPKKMYHDLELYKRI